MKGLSLAWVTGCALTSISTSALAGGHAMMSLARPAPPPHAAVMLHPLPAPAARSGYAHIPWNWNGHPLAIGNGQGWRFGYRGNRYGERRNDGNGRWTSALELGDGGYFGSPQDAAPQVAYVQPAPLILVEPFAVPDAAAVSGTPQSSSGPLIIYVNRDKLAEPSAGTMPRIVYGDGPERRAAGPEIIYGDTGK